MVIVEINPQIGCPQISFIYDPSLSKKAKSGRHKGDPGKVWCGTRLRYYLYFYFYFSSSRTPDSTYSSFTLHMNCRLGFRPVRGRAGPAGKTHNGNLPKMDTAISLAHGIGSPPLLPKAASVHFSPSHWLWSLVSGYVTTSPSDSGTHGKKLLDVNINHQNLTSPSYSVQFLVK